MPIWQVRGRRPSVDWRVFLETDDEARAHRHLAALRREFLGLTEYDCRVKPGQGKPDAPGE